MDDRIFAGLVQIPDGLAGSLERSPAGLQLCERRLPCLRAGQRDDIQAAIPGCPAAGAGVDQQDGIDLMVGNKIIGNRLCGGLMFRSGIGWFYLHYFPLRPCLVSYSTFNRSPVGFPSRPGRLENRSMPH